MTAYKHIWRLWGKFYSIGKLAGLMRRNHPFRLVASCPLAFSGVLCWLSRQRLAVSGDQLRVEAGFSLILSRSFYHSAKGVAVWPDLWHGTAIRSKCCRSSVVEHSLGKGEVESPILSGSTISGSFSFLPASQPASVSCSSCGTFHCTPVLFP